MYKHFFKRLIDTFLSFCGLVVCCIPMVIIAIKLNGKGMVFFKQGRLRKVSIEKLPGFLICKRWEENIYLCSVDFKYKQIVTDKDGYQFYNVADVPGVYFRRDNDVWKMENVNPYISVLEA